MKPIVLVLLVAASAFAAPSINVSVQSMNQNSIAYDPGNGVNGGLIQNVLDMVDNGDLNMYTITMLPAIQDLANGDAQSQALAVAQSMALLGSVGYGQPGNACAAINAINSVMSGGNGASYASTLANSMDVVALLSSNPAALKNQSGPQGQCQGSNYNFEAAWNIILDNASPSAAGLVNELYCAAKRLYNSNSAQSNNIAAAVTAASLPGVVQNVSVNMNVLGNTLRAASSGNGNVYAFANQAKQALQGGR